MGEFLKDISCLVHTELLSLRQHLANTKKEYEIIANEGEEPVHS